MKSLFRIAATLVVASTSILAFMPLDAAAHSERGL